MTARTPHPQRPALSATLGTVVIGCSAPARSATRVAFALFALLIVFASPAARPAAAQDARLIARLDPAIVPGVSALVDSARAEGLPVEPLVQKALEGGAKGAGPLAIQQAVHRLLARLRTAHDAVGDSATEPELVAAAATLELGASPSALRALREERWEGSLAAPLMGFAFLLQRGVPPDGSLEIVRSMLQARLTDADFSALRRLVDQDVRAGAPPADAATVRSRALIRHATPIRRENRQQP
jgi:hypothetical protein